MSYVLPYERIGVTCVRASSTHYNKFTELGVPLVWDWCERHFGPPTNCQYGQPATEFYWGVVPGPGYTMYFADPAHATMFALRWS
jgi:hypothetical protein